MGLAFPTDEMLTTMERTNTCLAQVNGEWVPCSSPFYLRATGARVGMVVRPMEQTNKPSAIMNSDELQWIGLWMQQFQRRQGVVIDLRDVVAYFKAGPRLWQESLLRTFKANKQPLTLKQGMPSIT